MDRRKFLKLGIGSAALVSGKLALLSWAPRADAANLAYSLSMVSGIVPMVDGRNLYLFSYQDAALTTAFPGPTLICREGDVLDVTLTNKLATNSAFAVAGTTLRTDVAANSSVTYSFAAPAPGTYLYHDDLNNGVNRVMGLHGALVVMPAGTSNQSFADGPTFVRQYKWLLGNFDPLWCDAVQANGDNHVATLAAQTASFTPKYFTINGGSYDQTHNADTALTGAVGNAALVRMLNAGMAVHSMHFHANHVELCSINQRNFTSLRKKKDVISMFPLDTRDVIFPFIAPPDIPAGEFDQGLNLAAAPQHYPMHCHTELSQTAGGGFYPHGMHTSIMIGKDPNAEPDLTQAASAL